MFLNHKSTLMSHSKLEKGTFFACKYRLNVGQFVYQKIICFYQTVCQLDNVLSSQLYE